jgi:Amidase
MAVAGFAVGAGVPTWLDGADPEPRHAVALQRLLDAGASVAGIARTDQLAYSLAGTNEHDIIETGGVPPNVAVPGAVPGGSTSGSSAAVALGAADLGLGTDTAGSIRVPASYEGIWGLRTTHGAVDRTGVPPLAPAFDTVGVLARDAPTLAAATGVVLDAGAGRRPVDPAFVVAPQLLDGVEDDVSAAFEGRAGRRPAPRRGADPRPRGDRRGVPGAPGVAGLAGPRGVDRGAPRRLARGRPCPLRGRRPDHSRRGRPRPRRAGRRAPGARRRPRSPHARPSRCGLLRAAAGGRRRTPRAGASRHAAAHLPRRCHRPAGGGGALVRTDGGPVGLSLLGPRDADLALVRLATRLPRPPAPQREETRGPTRPAG